jgi:hypothetical protein
VRPNDSTRWVAVCALLAPLLLDACGSSHSSPPLARSVKSVQQGFPVPSGARVDPSHSTTVSGAKIVQYKLPPTVTTSQIDAWYAATLPAGQAWDGLPECVAEQRRDQEVYTEGGISASVVRWWSDGSVRFKLIVIRTNGAESIDIFRSVQGC